MSDADLLRRAAALMRERAEAATPGPWVRSGSSIETDHECSPSHDCWPVGDTYSGMKPDGSTYPRDLNRADAEHIASWHPAVALAVADWLDAEAESHRADLVGPFPSACCRMSQARAVARAFLGSDDA